MRDSLATVLDIRSMYYRAAEAYLSEVNESDAKKYLSFAEECYEFAVELGRRMH